MFEKRRGVLIVLALISIASLFSGCATFDRVRIRRGEVGEEEAIVEQEVPLEVAASFKFDDIPIPYGFRIDQFDSFAFQTDYSRVGVLKYIGRSKPEQVVAFYKDQMPLYGWTMVNIIEYGRRLLNFEKEGQSCIITIDPTKTKTILTIATSPKTELK